MLRSKLLLYLPCYRTISRLMEKVEMGYDFHHIENFPSKDTEISHEEALKYFTEMNLIRKMEIAISHVYEHKLMRGFCHLYVGQEACAVGIRSVMRPQDTVITSYRCHAWPLMMGDTDHTMKEIFAEMLGKKTGLSKGKGGSMHLYYEKFYGGNGIVASHVPLGTGIALTHKYKNDGGICFDIFGDGAANNGQTQESFNMAKLHNLPVVYVIENNQYGMGTSTERSSANTDYYTRGDLIPGVRTSGMDVVKVRTAMQFAVNHVTSGLGPIIVELVTYRYFGHSMSDPGTSYRSRDEISKIRATVDPLTTFRKKATSEKLVTEDELDAIEKKNKSIVEKHLAAAKADPEPGHEDLLTFVYKEYNSEIRDVPLNVLSA